MKFDFETDDESLKLFEITVHFLQVYFKYPAKEAVSMLNEYHRQWESIHQDDDFYHHIGAYESAVRIHYFQGLKADSRDYITWRMENGFNKTPREALEYWRNNY
jgi:hypothetical protein